MSLPEPPSPRNLVLYEMFVRNHTAAGTLAAAAADLPRIRAMGVDCVWLMPIHPIGRLLRKGGEGSPYAICDYLAVHPDLGDEGDLVAFIAAAHDLGLRVMLDVVFNHCAPDAEIARANPAWCHCDPAGRPRPRHAEWSDVVDLGHPRAELAAHLIGALVKWAGLGVDGFRCDVAPLVPVKFWQEARQAVAAVRPGAIWLAESVHPEFLLQMRRQGYVAHADAELYPVFDLTYDYDIHRRWTECVAGRAPLAAYAEAVARQEASLPAGAAKLRFVENHDQPRLPALVRDPHRAANWTALAAFLPGALLIHGGQETGTDHLPALFEKDPIAWPDGEPPLAPLLTRLSGLKKDPATAGAFDLAAGAGHFLARWEHGDRRLEGLFNVRGAKGRQAVPWPDGQWRNLLDDTAVTVAGGRVDLPRGPLVVELPAG